MWSVRVGRTRAVGTTLFVVLLLRETMWVLAGDVIVYDTSQQYGRHPPGIYAYKRFYVGLLNVFSPLGKLADRAIYFACVNVFLF